MGTRSPSRTPTASAYSVRPLPDARVSMPLSWENFFAADPAEFTLRTVPAIFAARGDAHAGIDAAVGSIEKLLELADRQEAEGLPDAPWPPHYAKGEDEAPRVSPSRAKGAAKIAKPKLPVITIAQAKTKPEALAGLERWKERHPAAAALLAAKDVLVDTNRGRSSAWYRVWINLENVPGPSGRLPRRPIPTTTGSRSGPGWGRMKAMRISAVAVVMIGLFAGAPDAQAQPDTATAQAAFAEGQRRYSAGEYLPAATKFEAAYAADPDPVYLFNVAQAYRLGNACLQAVSYYRRFLEAVPNPPNLAKVNQYLEQAESCAKAMAPVDPAPPTNPPLEPLVADPPLTERPASEDLGRTKRWLGIGGLVIGGAAIGIGVYYTTEASRLTDERLEARRRCLTVPCMAGYGDAIDAAGETAARRAKISFAVGGAAAIGGVVLYMLGRSPERSSIAVLPTSGGAYAVGAFTF